MTNEAWDAVLAYSLIFGPFAAMTVGSFLWLVFKRNPPADFYDAYGDATETPTMLHNTRRVNFREDV